VKNTSAPAAGAAETDIFRPSGLKQGLPPARDSIEPRTWKTAPRKTPAATDARDGRPPARRRPTGNRESKIENRVPSETRSLTSSIENPKHRKFQTAFPALEKNARPSNIRFLQHSVPSVIRPLTLHSKLHSMTHRRLLLPGILACIFALPSVAGAQTPPAAAIAPLPEEEPNPLAGRITDRTYHAPGDVYRMSIPVRPELGGTVEDTPTTVTFQDAFGTFVLVGCVPLDAALSADEHLRGRKDFLTAFFAAHLQPGIQRALPGSRVESARFIRDREGGALLVFMLLPGGSMFNELLFIPGGERPPVAKRGHLLFVKNGCVFIISTELADKVFASATYNKTVDEENAILRQSLLGILARITFTMPAGNAGGGGGGGK
jgi:hypothetical protein